MPAGEAHGPVDTRREFLKKAALLSGAAGAWTLLPASIQRALAIQPAPGSTYLDAEHVVILMQENRSFDHCYGTLRGVRGFNDPRAITLANQNPVWLQTNAAGETYAPFRLNIRATRATWMGSLPHSWSDQVDARNQGRHDRWLDAKRPGSREYARMPLTLGYYTREDVPFYYALADAFTICDQHFCSSLTGTTPNRLYLWTGTLRDPRAAGAPANVRNEEVDYGAEVGWTTFPERLEDHGISWKIYQNELSLPAGFEGEEEDWLANFTDNPLEWFSQYQVRFATGYRGYLEEQVRSLPVAIEALEKRLRTLPDASPDAEALRQQIAEKTTLAHRLREERERWSRERFEKLPRREQNLHNQAFCTNHGDPFYHQLATLTYRDGETERQVAVPRGDVLHQFRRDTSEGKLPAVSWVVAPANFSDHPGSAWYGAWFVSEVLDILTQNPEVWKKTIFLLTYDENDGYFDHVPPFVAPHPRRPETGRVSAGIDPSVEYVTLEQDRKRQPAPQARESPIGLGYRVPLVIASPWSRGGCVCSQVFDHTSILQFLEVLLTHKTGKQVAEPNLSRWRRTVCGDLTSAFPPQRGEPVALPPFPSRDRFVEAIHQARFMPPPAAPAALTDAAIEQVKRDPAASPALPRQEPGVRRSCPLPYQHYAEGALAAEKNRFVLRLEARNEVFGRQAAGAPFNVYAYGGPDGVQVRVYAVAAGDRLMDSWEIGDAANGAYHLHVQGPNGFMREFRGSRSDPALEVQVEYARARENAKTLTGSVAIRLVNRERRSLRITLRDHGYGAGEVTRELRAGGRVVLLMETRRSHGWYDFSVTVAGREPFASRYAGRVETGNWSYSDPVMGRERGPA
jgi:phospholipase C